MKKGSKKNKRRWFSVTAKDCKFQTYRGSGNGGQKRNKTDSAVRCIHPPSGAVGSCEVHKEQKYNKREAFRLMYESAEFQSWLKLKIAAGLDQVTIEEGDEPPRKLRMDEV